MKLKPHCDKSRCTHGDKSCLAHGDKSVFEVNSFRPHNDHVTCLEIQRKYTACAVPISFNDHEVKQRFVSE